MQSSEQGIQQQLNHLDNVKRALREREKDLDSRSRYLNNLKTFPAGNVQVLRRSLVQSLPPYMMPGNVGGINEVTWPFYFQINLDYGINPAISQSNIIKGSFQIDQEAAFLLMAISRSHETDEEGFSATVTGPLQVELIDRQSSRRFSDQPTPLQMFGFNSCPSELPTPMYFQPNAFLDVIVSGLPLVAQNFTGSGRFQLSFFGYRIRTEDTNKVLSTIFQMP